MNRLLFALSNIYDFESNMTSPAFARFETIRQRARERKGGSAALEKILPDRLPAHSLARKTDAECLSVMSKCVFRAGFTWRVIDNKWPGFETAFYGFEPQRLLSLAPDSWDAYLRDTRIVRNWQKIKTVYDNALYITDTAATHGSFAGFLAEWPCNNQVGLTQHMKRYGSRLGGNTARYFLRFIGKDGYILSTDVVTALQSAGVDIHDKPASKRDLERVQNVFNTWHEETGLPYAHLSKIAAYSCGTNYDIDFIRREMRNVTEIPG